jgi:SAM-dependent MidA family methyltransferase
MSVALELPELTPDEATHSERLAERVRAEIARAGGWISFSRFMAMALYEPGLGYYSAGARKLGAAGDFVTAPEVAPVFSRCLAVQCAEILRGLGGGEVLELGAGSGVMAAAMLAELDRRDALPTRYRILDVSAELRERQRATLARAVPQWLDRVEWLDRLPERFSGVIVANEVLDAMPVERFALRGGEINALGVTWHFGRLEWSETRAPAPLREAVCSLRQQAGDAWPEGYVSEVNLGLGPWLESLGHALE